MQRPFHNIPVLMYHGLENVSQPFRGNSASERLYVISTEIFEEQIRYLAASGFSSIRLSDAKDTSCVAKPIILTFDDGHVSNYNLAAPILMRYGFTAEFFITTDRIDTDDHLSSEQIRWLAAQGMGIGAHGHTHRLLDELSAAEVYEELSRSKQILEDILGQPVVSISLPGGRMNQAVLDTAERLSFQSMYSSTFGYYSSDKKNTLIPRIAIRKNDIMKEFIKAVTGERAYVLTRTAQSAVLLLMKKLIGNAGYVLLHRYIAWMREQKTK